MAYLTKDINSLGLDKDAEKKLYSTVRHINSFLKNRAPTKDVPVTEKEAPDDEYEYDDR